MKCALRTWECHSAPADVPPADVPPADVTPGLVLNPTSDMTRSNMDIAGNPEKCEHEGWINGNEHSPWIVDNHQYENSDIQIYDSIDIAEWYLITTDCLQPDEGNCAPADFPPADASESDMT